MYLHPYAQLWSVSDLCCPPSCRLLPRIPLPLKLSDSIPPPDIIRRYAASLAHVHSLLYSTMYIYVYTSHVCVHKPIALPSPCFLCTCICTHSQTSAFRARCTLLQLDCHSRRLNFARKLRVPELNFRAFVSYISRFLQAASYDIAVGAMMSAQIVNDPNSNNVQTEQNPELK